MTFSSIKFVEQNLEKIKTFIASLSMQPKTKQENYDVGNKLDVTIIGQEEKNKVYDILKSNPTTIVQAFSSLEELNLHSIKLEASSLSGFINFIKNSQKLSSLSLSDCFSKTRDLKFVLDSLKANKQIISELKHLDLSDNNISDNFVYEVAECVKRLSGLERLELGYNSVKSGGVMYMIDAIVRNPNAKQPIECMFQANDITLYGGKFLSKFFDTTATGGRKVAVVLTSNAISSNVFKQGNKSNEIEVVITRSAQSSSLVTGLDDLTSVVKFYGSRKDNSTHLEEILETFLIWEKNMTSISDIDISSISKFATSLASIDATDLLKKALHPFGNLINVKILDYFDSQQSPILSVVVAKQNKSLAGYLTSLGASPVLREDDGKISNNSPLLVAWDPEDVELFDDLLSQYLTSENKVDKASEEKQGFIDYLISYFASIGYLDKLFEHLQEGKQEGAYQPFVEDFTTQYWEYCENN
jgi:Leucine-rich repeat (LRR) protein